MTKVQWTCILAIGAYLIWEFVVLAGWKETVGGAPIRVDLLYIFPALIVLNILSIVQFIRQR